MIPRLHGVSIACLAVLTVASACLAQDVVLPPVPAAPDSAGAPAAAASASTPTPMHLVKRASFGGLLGWGTVLADADYSSRRDAAGAFGSADTRSRPAFGATFRYQMTPWLRWQIAPGYLWVGYQQDSPIPFVDRNYPSDATKEKMLTQMLPASFQVQVTRLSGRWLYHLGAGPGLYRVWVQNRRKVLADPVSLKRHVGWYPGVSGEIGASRALQSLPSVSVEASLDAHWAFSTREEQFPSGFNAHVFAMGIKVGANYHFDPRRFAGAPSKPAGQ